jgi:hypothetical protein
MKTIFLIFTSFFTLSGFSQYYYQDIIGTSETTATIEAYLRNKVSKVQLTSYEANGMKTEDFVVEQVYNPRNQTLQTTTRSGSTDISVLTSFIDKNGKVIKTVDSSSSLISTTTYNYNADGKLASLINESTDPKKTVQVTEEHLWQYEDGKLKSMIRIKNKKDSSFISFKTDEAGNIIEEQSTRNGVKSDPVLYYYDANNNLTDIVRYNSKAKRLLPEYMFEYSPTGQVIQKITVPANSSNYLIWRYQYDINGLKVKEAIFNKDKKLTGRIDYQYVYNR